VRAFGTVGTAGLRLARNRDEVVAAIRDRTGLTVEVIPGEEESRLAYLAVQAGLGVPEGSLVVFDTGGGSTEFTFGRGPQVEERFSVNVGAVRYTEHFGLAGMLDPEVLGDAQHHRREAGAGQLRSGSGPDPGRRRPEGSAWLLEGVDGKLSLAPAARPVNVRHTLAADDGSGTAPAAIHPPSAAAGGGTSASS